MRRIALLLALLPYIAHAGEPIPGMVHDGSGQLAWADVRIALDEQRRIRVDFLGGDARQAQQVARMNARTETPSECRFAMAPSPAEHFKPTATLDDLVTHSDAIVSGRVTAIAQGFWYGTPGSLLRIESAYLRGDRRVESYIFYQYARIDTADGVICAKPMSEFTPPAIGDRLLIFAIGSPARTEAGDVFIVDTTRQMVHEPRGGKIAVPEALRACCGTATAFDSIERRVIGALKQRDATR